MATDSTPTSNPQFNSQFDPRFQSIGTRLLLSYLVVMTAILGISGVSIYHLLARRLHQQLDNHLQRLAQTSARTLGVVRHEYEEHRDKRYGYDSNDPDLPENLSELMAKYRQEGIFDVPSDYPLPDAQGVEWFDDRRQLMIREGNLFPDWDISANVPEYGLTKHKSYVKSYAIPVYGDLNGKRPLIGYVRASESTAILEAELRRLRWGLGIGGLVALGLTAIGGTWLTRQSLKPVERSFDRLKQFTADASHELRSPLTAIKTSVAVMQSHPERIHPNDIKKVAAIASAADQMSELVEDLLLLARIDDTSMPESMELFPVPIDEIVEDALDRAAIAASQKEIVLHYPDASIENVEVCGNAGHLRRLFGNLIDNAVQYTPEGGTVTVSIQRQTASVVVSVVDTGIGIASEDLPRIFDRFWRADKARSRRQGGTGLGLSIACTIAHRYGGEITVSSQLGVGTQFRIKFPLASSYRESVRRFTTP
ncbi:sensor histidine kinase [Baaleninema simplex]|uniref:sensor histidine kinase n=1 Tax=Baaleninema simplex TaxID=2862350 RepID=UPI00036350B9|nr:HAMP domain-containing sensor histidine kinase [Baaleninema simplex]